MNVIIDHAATAHLDTPKERALRNDLDRADFEVKQLKRKIAELRVIPLSAEADAMFYWHRRCSDAEAILRRYRLSHLMTGVNEAHLPANIAADKEDIA